MKSNQVIAALGALAHEHRLAVYRLLVARGPGGLPAGTIADRVGLVPMPRINPIFSHSKI